MRRFSLLNCLRRRGRVGCERVPSQLRFRGLAGGFQLVEEVRRERCIKLGTPNRPLEFEHAFADCGLPGEANLDIIGRGLARRRLLRCYRNGVRWPSLCVETSGVRRHSGQIFDDGADDPKLFRPARGRRIGRAAGGDEQQRREQGAGHSGKGAEKRRAGANWQVVGSGDLAGDIKNAIEQIAYLDEYGGAFSRGDRSGFDRRV